MDNQDSHLTLAEIMAGIEEKISRHYKVYADKFQEHRDFWNTLATEELDHAQWIRKLYSQTVKGRLSFNEKRFNKESLQEFSGRLEDMLAGFQRESKSMKEALSKSLTIETFILERKFFEVFETDSPELKMVLVHLAEATEEHRDRITKFMERFQ